MPSRRQRILEAFVARLRAIRKVDGFDTDAGLHVHLAEAPAFGPDDPETVIAVVIGDDAPRFQMEKVLNHLPLEVQVLADVSRPEDMEKPWLAIEAVLGDVKRAVELADRRFHVEIDGKTIPLLTSELLRGPTRTLPRETGTTVVGAGIAYFAPFAEVWGRP